MEGKTLTLAADVPLLPDDRGASADFTLSKGQAATFVMAYGRERPVSVKAYRTGEKLEKTKRYWEDLVAKMEYEGLWREQVTRSFLVLHLMVYRRTGAIVAAPHGQSAGNHRRQPETGTTAIRGCGTPALPWDVLYRLGDVYGADRYIHWLIEQCQLQSQNTRIVYGISPDSSLEEYTLDHLRGYEDSRPRAHWQRRGRSFADGRIRRGDSLHPFPADLAWDNPGCGLGGGAEACRDGDE